MMKATRKSRWVQLNFEGLEGRDCPSPLAALRPLAEPPGEVGRAVVVVVPNHPPTGVVDLRPLLTAVDPGDHGGGPRPSLVGNTNSGLVRTDLSGTQLTLGFVPGKCGEAVVTLVGTYPDGVAVVLEVTVCVLPPAR